MAKSDIDDSTADAIVAVDRVCCRTNSSRVVVGATRLSKHPLHDTQDRGDE